MAYTRPIKFTTTNRYGCGPDSEDDVYTVEEFREHCKRGLFIDYDGDGHPAKDGFADPKILLKPSNLELIPADATHVIWFNR